MSEPKFTPGPWEAQCLDANDHDAMSKYVDATIRVGGTQYFLVMGAHDDGRPADVAHTGNGPRSAYNARLIAAAPELFAALSRAMEWAGTIVADEGFVPDGLLGAMHDALLKAVGR